MKSLSEISSKFKIIRGKKVKLLVELDAFKGELAALEKPLVEVRDSL